MFCKNCGTEIEEGLQVCPACGLAIAEAVIEPAAEEVFEPAVETGEPKKKKRILKPVIIVLLVAVLGVGAFFGFTLWKKQRNYDQAGEHLKDKNYDEALVLYMDLEGYKDADAQAQKLVKLQKDYDSAKKQLKEEKYSEAQAAFLKLKDYRDSRQYADYAEAQAAFTEADKAEKYAAAAALFADLGDFEDSAEMVGRCYLEAAHAATEKSGAEAAQEYLDKLTEEQKAQYEAAYHDAEILEGWEKALQVRYDMESKAKQDGADYTEELEMLEPLLELSCKDKTLKALLEDYYAVVKKQQKTLDRDGYVEDVLEFYETQLERAYILNDMHDDFDLLKDLEDLCERYVDVDEYYEWCVEIETLLFNWYNGIRGYEENEYGKKVVQFDNTTDLWYTLEITVGYFDKNDEIISEQEWVLPMSPSVKSIQLVLEIPEGMEYWDILYSFRTYDENAA